MIWIVSLLALLVCALVSTPTASQNKGAVLVRLLPHLWTRQACVRRLVEAGGF
jgi:hypothetical protein